MTPSIPVRTLVAWCPDWPVVAAGFGAGEPAVVVTAGAGGRVVACSAAARAQGVHPGLRRREAQALCPDVQVVVVDPERDARVFEAVAAAVEALTPRLEVVCPGSLALPTRGPSRYFGGDAALAARVAALAESALGGRGRCRVGVADGLFAAALAARRGQVVEPGASAAFLAPLPVTDLDSAALDSAAGGSGAGVSAAHDSARSRRPAAPGAMAELVELFRRLGLRTLGDVAAIPPADLAGRFGPAGARASRLCRGIDDRTTRLRVPSPDLVVAAELYPPADRVEAAAFVARALAAELAERLATDGLACARVRIEAQTEHGEVLSRRWRTEGLTLPAALVERARWQLDGWCNGTGAVRPTGGISVLRLVPEDVGADRGRQLGFWGGATAADERAARGVARLQGMLGFEAVSVPRRRGGRGPGEQVALVAAYAAALGNYATRPTALTGATAGAPVTGATIGTDDGAAAPWPGHLPAPSPALVFGGTVPAEVLSITGEPVTVTGRGLVTAAPGRVSLAGGPEIDVVDWTGPWPVEERWWDQATRCRRARIQVVTAAGEAHLLALTGGRWALEATYD